MKLVQLFILVTFIFGLGFTIATDAFGALNPYRSRCVGIQGKFTAENWNGTAIQVGCAGDDGLAVSDPAEKCTGEVLTVRPGQTYRLTKCSCFGDDNGCLVKGKNLKLEPLVNGRREVTQVTKLNQVSYFQNNDCWATSTANVCGSNGQHITGDIKIKCRSVLAATTTATPTPANFTPVPTTEQTPTPTGDFCPVPEQVPNVRIICPDCGEIPTPSPVVETEPTPTENPDPTPTISPTEEPTPTIEQQTN